ncbi:hypothetical protein PsorP6_017840 [Peronosclerospora sorghi]|uniref:Uncharacterized protein n=1 Tax=Peronosclerospora sorghi TaxID=230839 RepID=A0ACC0WDU7_9STRA|nr:hypothetical protein PsorP6_017840 [Peronosclerospora sorghi]
MRQIKLRSKSPVPEIGGGVSTNKLTFILVLGLRNVEKLQHVGVGSPSTERIFQQIQELPKTQDKTLIKATYGVEDSIV